MDRELAIERLTKMGWVCDMDGCNINCDVCAEALDLVIEALKAEPTGDLISRQEAVEEIAKMIKKAQEMGSQFDLAVSYGFMGAKATIEDLPSAEPRQHHLGKHADITVIDEVATHDKRTETHECVSETHGDLISRSDTIKAMCLECDVEPKCDVWIEGTEHLCTDVAIVKDMPSADTDMSDYSDRLWKAAYERGKAEGLGKLKNPCDSLLKPDSDECKEHKSKLDLISRQAAVERLTWHTDFVSDKNFEDGEVLLFKDSAIEQINALPSAERTGEWVPVSERLPEDLDEVNVTWVNHNPPVYYEHIMDKPTTGFAVRYDEKWYWWDSAIVDTLAEYGNQDFLEPIDKGIEIIAWMPLPEPYKGGDTE